MDAAKGATILLVVLHHACTTLVDGGADLVWWGPVDEALTAVRMPLFFLLSGLFARAVAHGPGVRLWRDRVARFVYLFVLWSVLYLPFYAAEAAIAGRNVGDEVALRAGQLALALSPMWFVLALAGFFTIARLARSVAPTTQIPVAATVAVAVPLFDVPYPFDKLWLLPFFLIGCYYSRQIRDSVARLGAERLAQSPAVRPFRWVGSHTLPVCVLHVPMLSIAVQAQLLGGLGVAGPPVVAAYATVGALVAWSLLRRHPGLFALPRCVAGASSHAG